MDSRCRAASPARKSASSVVAGWPTDQQKSPQGQQNSTLARGHALGWAPVMRNFSYPPEKFENVMDHKMLLARLLTHLGLLGHTNDRARDEDDDQCHTRRSARGLAR